LRFASDLQRIPKQIELEPHRRQRRQLDGERLRDGATEIA